MDDFMRLNDTVSACGRYRSYVIFLLYRFRIEYFNDSYKFLNRVINAFITNLINNKNLCVTVSNESQNYNINNDILLII